jgi:magnesium transporter
VIGGVWLIDGGQFVVSTTGAGGGYAGEPEPTPLSRIADRGELSEMFSQARTARRDGRSAYLWVDVTDPTAQELAKLGDVFGLPRLQVEDALNPRQRPKVERSGAGVFLVLRSLEYFEATSEVETHQVAAFAGPGYFLTIAHDRSTVAASVHGRIAREPALRRRGSIAGCYALLDVVVDEYLAIAAAIGDDIEEIEESVFSPARSDDSAAIYALKRENLELRRAAGPLAIAANQAIQGLAEQVDGPFELYFRDVADHLLRVVEYADNHDQLLMTMLMASTARQDLQQNADMRRISAWVAIAAVPTVIAGVYGMNFVFMPELDEWWGYPFALSLMALACLGLYRVFKRARWL